MLASGYLKDHPNPAHCNSTGIAELMRQADAIRRRNDVLREQGLPGAQHGRWQDAQRTHEIVALRACAATRFAALNGWRYSRRGFNEATLARGGVHDAWSGGHRMPAPHRLFDHNVYFREIERPYRTKALVAQPYGLGLDDASEIAASLGLALHAPPNLTASWWYPGSARFFCLTRPDVTEVAFLPDQIDTGKGLMS